MFDDSRRRGTPLTGDGGCATPGPHHIGDVCHLWSRIHCQGQRRLTCPYPRTHRKPVGGRQARQLVRADACQRPSDSSNLDNRAGPTTAAKPALEFAQCAVRTHFALEESQHQKAAIPITNLSLESEWFVKPNKREHRLNLRQHGTPGVVWLRRGRVRVNCVRAQWGSRADNVTTRKL